MELLYTKDISLKYVKDGWIIELSNTKDVSLKCATNICVCCCHSGVLGADDGECASGGQGSRDKV